GLAPVPLVAPVDHRDGAGERPVALRREERTHRAILGEGTVALERGQEERDQGRPAHRPTLVDAILKEDEVGERGFTLRALYPDRHAILIEQSPARHQRRPLRTRSGWTSPDRHRSV